MDQIMAYEQGELDPKQVVELFRALVDSGLAWSLPGHYGRTAMSLINAGLIPLSHGSFIEIRKR
jgi:hypothetical protein